MSEITVTSEQFQHEGQLPTSAAHPAVGGQNRSPQLSWSAVPEGTRSIAVTCYDPDAPTTVGFVHWVRFGIDPSERSLDEGAGTAGGPGTDGFTDWGERQYGGMAPPAGDAAHHYHFTVYALDSETLGLDPDTTYAKFRFLTRGHVLATGTITGRYAVEG